MAIYTSDDSQQKAAKVAGFAYLITFAIVVLVNFFIHERLMVAANVAETAWKILAHELLFRIGIAGHLVYEAALVVLLSALYVILKPVDRTLALLAAFWRLIYASMWVLMSLNLLTALRLLTGADYLRVLGTEQSGRIGWLRCNCVRLGRRVYSGLHHFSCLRIDCEPVVVRFWTRDFRTGDRLLARIQN